MSHITTSTPRNSLLPSPQNNFQGSLPCSSQKGGHPRPQTQNGLRSQRTPRSENRAANTFTPENPLLKPRSLARGDTTLPVSSDAERAGYCFRKGCSQTPHFSCLKQVSENSSVTLSYVSSRGHWPLGATGTKGRCAGGCAFLKDSHVLVASAVCSEAGT